MALLVLLFSYVPRYVGRYLVTSQLDELGIQYTGIDSLTINPWTWELWLGQVQFGSGSSEHAQVGELGLNIRFNPLLEHRFSIEQLLVRGIELVVTRSMDNDLVLNGIPLNQFFPKADASAPPEPEGTAWDAGLDSFELRESRLVFKDREQGVLEVDVERLVLREFATWEPDRPGLFELAARVNGIQLNWSGEARPFADNITLSIDSRTLSADVPKVVRFTGPWGLDRREGNYDAALNYQVTLFESGRLEGHTRGSIEIRDADYQRAGVFALLFQQAGVDIDIHYRLSESGDFEIKGQIEADLGPTTGALGDDTSFAIASGRLALKDLDTKYANNGELHLALGSDIDLEKLEFSGPIEISIEQLVDALALLQSLSAGSAVRKTNTGLGDYAATKVELPASDIKVGRLQGKGASLSLQSARGQVDLGLQVSTDLAGITVGTNGKQLSIEQLESRIEQLNLTSGHGKMALDLAGKHSLSKLTGSAPLGEFKVAAFDFRLGELNLQSQTGAISLQVAAAAQNGSGISGLLYGTKEHHEMLFKLAATNAAVRRTALNIKDDTLNWQVEGGDAVLDSLVAEFQGTEGGAIKFNNAVVSSLQANEQLQFAADAFTVDGLDLYLKRSLFAGAPGVTSKDSQKGSLVGEDVAEPGVVQAAADKPSQEIDVGRLQTLLTAQGFEPGPVDGILGQRTARAIGDFQRRVGMPVDGRPSTELIAVLESRVAKPVGTNREAISQVDVGVMPVPAVSVGRLALTGTPVIRFRDDLMTPQVNIDSVFKEVEVRNLNTQKGAERTELSLKADANEFTHIELVGWFVGIGPTADLDFEAKLENLELSTYSPYVAELAGVYLESGQLDMLATANAGQGALKGEIQLELDDLAFKPLSSEDAERLSGTVGMPLETTVRLLQDDEGRIMLTLPVSGQLWKPEVDISSAVNKAVGGVLKSVFPPSIVVSMLKGIAKGSDPSFEPIVFSPGSSNLTEAGERYLGSIVKLMAQHPKVSLKVCGRATAQDIQQYTTRPNVPVATSIDGKRPAGQPEPVQDLAKAGQALTELAIERQSAVRRYMIQEKAVDVRRFPECRSTFDASDEGSPRVEILL